MPSRQPPDLSHRHRHLPIAAALAGAAALSLLAATLIAFLLRRCLSRSRPALTVPSAAPLRRFSPSQLRRATSSFSPSHRLGQGGFGPVFRGLLPSLPLPVAVKLMDSGSLQGEREFHNELSIAAHIAASGASPFVVPPVGYSDSLHSRSRWPCLLLRPNSVDHDTDYFSTSPAPTRRLMLVYELMQNGSLQDALLGRRCPELVADWGRRFSVAVDIARGLHFLHCLCDPPIIHGDIKPSNILLDSTLSARIADFGLARLKIDDTPVPTAAQLDEEDAAAAAAATGETDFDAVLNHRKDPAASPETLSRHNGEDDGSVMGETAESTATNGIEEEAAANHAGTTGIAKDECYAAGSSPVDAAIGFEVASTSEVGGFNRMSMDSRMASSSRRAGRKKGSVLGGKDWWWRQDSISGGGGSEPGGSVKDYVMEWIRSEIKKERPKSDWISNPSVAAEDCLPKVLARSDRKKQPRRLEWWASLDEEKLTKKERPAREWWREEFCDELTNKQKQRAITKSHSSVEAGEHQWWQKDDDSVSAQDRRKKRRKKKSGSFGTRASMDRWMDRGSGELRTTGRRNSHDLVSGDIPRSGTVSSTPSMRGTVCYVAPEYGGGGPISEKCDVYSFGVLLLVLISGRRPLQVTASPMSEFERANLISWTRHLARLGRLLDLLDPALHAVDRDQALLCITVALLCIQRSPARRPTIKEILGILTGELELPHLPPEFSPSPPGGFTFKSRKKVR